MRDIGAIGERHGPGGELKAEYVDPRATTRTPLAREFNTGVHTCTTQAGARSKEWRRRMEEKNEDEGVEDEGGGGMGGSLERRPTKE